jgi:hypothetical protein
VTRKIPMHHSSHQRPKRNAAGNHPSARKARSEALETLLAEIHRTAPPWSKVPPWVAEKMFERQQQRKLFGGGK